MSTAEVRLWGTQIGAVSWDAVQEVSDFEYAEPFLTSGIELSPLKLPLARGVFRFPELPRRSFQGLPGLLADSLPDRFGNAVIDAWLVRQERNPASFNPVERLCYIGQRGMGALEFHPTTGPRADKAETLEVAALVELASEILSRREDLAGQFTPTERADTLRTILRVGTSAGGARAKAVIAWNPATGEVRSGQVEAGSGFEPWLLKFDGVASNRDKELADPKGYGTVEFAYHRMALAAGIEMSPCRLLTENGRRHFMTRRFDRTPTGDKLHMQSLGALAHFDYNLAGAYAYEQAIDTMRRLELELPVIEQFVRRIAFNLVARNQDDHVKNIAFLMDRGGRWSLAPAFDLTYSFNPTGEWTSRHQMTLNGKRNGFTEEDFKALNRFAGLPRGRTSRIFREVIEVVREWPTFAEEAEIATDWSREIGAHHRLRFPPK